VFGFAQAVAAMSDDAEHDLSVTNSPAAVVVLDETDGHAANPKNCYQRSMRA
jgi:hypothetical protein